VVIVSSGAVGISTGNPQALLEISSPTAQATTSLLMVDTEAVAGQAPILTVLAGGNVGIGTTSPQAALQVQSSANTAALIIATPGAVSSGGVPTAACNSTDRGGLIIVQGTPDIVYICLQMNSAGSYQWVQLARGQ
jgi:hypothetical protein